MQNYKTVEKQYSDSNVFSNYKVTLNDGTILYVPPEEANTDYQNILEWEKIEGNVIEEAD